MSDFADLGHWGCVLQSSSGRNGVGVGGGTSVSLIMLQAAAPDLAQSCRALWCFYRTPPKSSLKNDEGCEMTAGEKIF
eukprot:980399-Pelagomonas_calceolata.AAC.2